MSNGRFFYKSTKINCYYCITCYLALSWTSICVAVVYMQSNNVILRKDKFGGVL